MALGIRDAVDLVIGDSLKTLKSEGFPLHTFALYFDHESSALAVCADSRENSKVQVASQNEYSFKYFRKCIKNANTEEAQLWQANIGRNLSLGDFSRVNLGRVELPEFTFTNEACIAMVERLLSWQDQIASLAPGPDELIFCCSTPSDEVGLVFSHERGAV